MSRKSGNKWKEWLGMRTDVPASFYVTDFLFRRILRQNALVKWAVHHTSTIHYPERIIRGKDVYPGDSPGVYINAYNGVEIGDGTNIGPHVGILSANHDFVDNSKHVSADPIRIGRFCWIGKGCSILPSVVLGDFTIVGAGAVVTRSFPEGHCVIAGNPARIIRYLNPSECRDFAANKHT